MGLRNITLAGTILLVLAFTVNMAGAADQNATDNEKSTVTVTGNSTETLTANPAEDDDSGEGLIGPGNALYGLQIAFDNIGEVFIFNASEKLGKQVSNARKRIAEARAALRRNDTEAANRALAEYDAKMRDVNVSMSKLSDNDTGFINAQKMILKHQLILQNLSISNPGNKGLQRAYNNSRELQVKFVPEARQKPDLIAKGDQETVNDKKTGVASKDERPEKGTKR